MLAARVDDGGEGLSPGEVHDGLSLQVSLLDNLFNLVRGRS